MLLHKLHPFILLLRPNFEQLQILPLNSNFLDLVIVLKVVPSSTIFLIHIVTLSNIALKLHWLNLLISIVLDTSFVYVVLSAILPDSLTHPPNLYILHHACHTTNKICYSSKKGHVWIYIRQPLLQPWKL